MRIARIHDRDHASTRLIDVKPEDEVGIPLRPVDDNHAPDVPLETLLALGPPSEVLIEDGPAIDLSSDAIRWLSPIEDPHIIVCAGQNFASHADESVVVQTPLRPSAFLRVSRTLTGHRATVPHPAASSSFDYEVEVAVVIGSPAVDVTAEDALDYVAGLCLANDLSARDIQFDEAKAGSMLLGKNQPDSLPLGPWMTTVDEIDDLSVVDIRLQVNGHERQADRLSSMTMAFPELIAYWSVLGLRPGDLVLSGTPPGVAIFQDPPEDYLLAPGDTVVCASSQLGELEVVIGQPVSDTV